jgi:urea carboxylase
LFSTVWKIKCQVGDVIKSDSEVLFILEAMKTEVAIISGEGSKGKVVSDLNVREGLSVQPGDVLASLR